jgi:Na+-transporting methylmalonyl-CoA/oxaloacetate decarboxylase beta subunit
MDIGIIGGADGPTTIFLTSNNSGKIILAMVIFIIVVGLIIKSIRKM